MATNERKSLLTFILELDGIESSFTTPISYLTDFFHDLFILFLFNFCDF